MKRKSKYILHIFLVLTITTSYAQTDCKKCDIEKIKSVNANIDHLTFKMVEDFLCTFDSSCKTNIEFSQWSNEMLYKILNKEPELIILILDQSQIENIEILLDEIENPIHEFNYQDIYEIVSKVKTGKDFKQQVLESIEVAADKEGIKIQK
jgi:hypothetical protein